MPDLNQPSSDSNSNSQKNKEIQEVAVTKVVGSNNSVWEKFRTFVKNNRVKICSLCSLIVGYIAGDTFDVNQIIKILIGS